ncbi:hypothetical protein [Polaromonas sp.]|uniref:hypothetical protein n=1 Tax=Polaromonas sp. TaxID=1869339 RepID=UPI00352BB65A
MTPARSWLSCFVVGFAVIVAMLLVTLFTPAPYGDLTRIGRLSDAEFGWRAPPPVVEKADILGVPLAQADVLVVGDSFSMTHRWQSRLVQNGYKVSTIYWGQIGWLCEDFSSWIRKAGFRGNLVVVESVERLLGERLDKGAQCKAMVREPLVKTTPFLEPLESVPGFALNWSAKLTTGVITYANMRNVRQSSGDTVYSDETRVRAVKDGCKYFSHRMCDKALFFIEDTDNPPLQPVAVEQMKTFTASQPDFRFVWMVIPDKTTVYIDHEHAAGFSKAFKDSKLGPDLFSFAAEERERVRDFYFPNDTHLSMHGQLILGERMLESVREILPPPRPRTP